MSFSTLDASPAWSPSKKNSTKRAPGPMTARGDRLRCSRNPIGGAPADDKLRDKWLTRLWDAVQDDAIPYLELLPDHWGSLCATAEHAANWADTFLPIVRMAWSGDPGLRGYFKGTTACLSALHKAERHAAILELLELAPYKSWHYRKWGVKALVALCRKGEVVEYAEEGRNVNDSSASIARACEEILLSSGLTDEAYSRYAIAANQGPTYLATFRAICRKYPHKTQKDVLADLVASIPGERGKWFAAAKSAGLYDEAIELASRNPCDPKTLIRAARDCVAEQPKFAIEAGIAALRWMAVGYGYDITGLDVLSAYDHTIAAAHKAGCEAEIVERIRKVVMEGPGKGSIVMIVLARALGMATK
jgi:hypothetical protein